MNKKSAIKRFNDACKYPFNNIHRELSVKTQLNRNLWEVNDDNGLIMIKMEKTTTITVFNTIRYAEINKIKEVSTYRITEKEYNELKKTYFGIYKSDFKYLKKTGAVIEVEN